MQPWRWLQAARSAGSGLSPVWLWACKDVFPVALFMSAADRRVGSQALAKLLAVGYSRRDVYLHCAPLFHIGGLSSALAVLAAGAVQARTQCSSKLQATRSHGFGQ